MFHCEKQCAFRPNDFGREQKCHGNVRSTYHGAERRSRKNSRSMPLGIAKVRCVADSGYIAELPDTFHKLQFVRSKLVSTRTDRFAGWVNVNSNPLPLKLSVAGGGALAALFGLV